MCCFIQCMASNDEMYNQSNPESQGQIDENKCNYKRLITTHQPQNGYNNYTLLPCKGCEHY